MKILLSLTGGCILTAAMALNLAAQSPSPGIDGTYILDYRELPDGKQVRPPEIIGSINLIKGHRNFNIYWQQDGKPVSLSSISKYTFTPTEYSEDNIYYMMSDGPSGKPPIYDTAATTGKSPVTITGDKIQFKLPLHGEPEVVFDSTGFTATRAGEFVDHWKKME